MKQIKFILSIFSCIITQGVIAQSNVLLIDNSLTLEQCVDFAIKNNIDVKNSETTMERNRILWQQARTNLLPTINVNSTYGTTYGRGSTNSGITISAAESKSFNVRASSSFVLSSGLSLINNIKQNALLYQAGKMDFQQIKEQTTLNIVSLYFTALNGEDQLAQAKMQLEASKTNFDRSTLLNEAGNISPADYYNIKGAYENDAVNVSNAETAVLTSHINLLEAMNIPFNKEMKLVRPQPNEVHASYGNNPNDIYNIALNKLPQIKAAALKVQAANREVASAKGKYFPTLLFDLHIQSGYFSNSGQTPDNFDTQLKNNKLYGPSISLSIPILSYSQIRNNVKLTKLNLKFAQDNDWYTKIQLKQQIEQAYANMQNTYRRLQIFTAQVNTYHAAYDAQKAKFDEGVITSELFIIAKNNLDGANVNLINAQYDYLMRTKILDYYQGRF